MKPTVAVLGSGTMGRGIAQVAATCGCQTTLNDIETSLLEGALTSVKGSVDRAIEKGKMEAGARAALENNLRLETDLASAVAGADIVIEAVPEKLDLKIQILSSVAASVDADCVLATNTSSLSITGIAAGVPGPERVVGMHFFNPVPVMKLVEVVSGVETSDKVIETTVGLSRAWGKEPIVVQDSPGFATSRLGLVIGLEAVRMLEAGVGSAEDIDRAMELGYRHPMGPLRLTDLVGLDVRLAIAEHLHREVGEQFRPPALLRKLVRAGHLGRKTGRGFYTYE